VRPEIVGGRAEADFGPVQPSGCKGKVDLLFVISRLGTSLGVETV